MSFQAVGRCLKESQVGYASTSFYDDSRLSQSLKALVQARQSGHSYCERVLIDRRQFCDHYYLILRKSLRNGCAGPGA